MQKYALLNDKKKDFSYDAGLGNNNYSFINELLHGKG